MHELRPCSSVCSLIPQQKGMQQQGHCNSTSTDNNILTGHELTRTVTSHSQLAAHYKLVPPPPTFREFADSKTLTEEKRDRLFEQIKADPCLGHLADILSAQLISSKMLSRERVSLNELANESTYSLIDAVLARGVNLTEVYVDTVGDAAKYQVSGSVGGRPNAMLSAV